MTVATPKWMESKECWMPTKLIDGAVQLFTESQRQDGSLPPEESGFGGCRLRGIALSGGRHLENLGRRK